MTSLLTLSVEPKAAAMGHSTPKPIHLGSCAQRLHIVLFTTFFAQPASSVSTTKLPPESSEDLSHLYRRSHQSSSACVRRGHCYGAVHNGSSTLHIQRDHPLVGSSVWLQCATTSHRFVRYVIYAGLPRGSWFEQREDAQPGQVLFPRRQGDAGVSCFVTRSRGTTWGSCASQNNKGQQLSKEPRPGDVHGHIAMKIRVGKRPLPAPQHISRLAGWTRTPPLVACCPASQGRLRCVSSKAAWLTGSGDDGEHIHTTNFGESLDLEQPDARATEESLNQSGEVQLERQDSNLRHSSHIHCHDDVAIRTVAENYDKRVAPHTKIKFENTADQKPRRGRLRR
ncbi:uncharacterized protein LOC142559893 [Dermacentor variabilis]|uniref:uncharacterized protein LOC142559893 n=1 Tax=Dermacentor variabilis TaxID=34621 RepID=UPI003F5CB639